MPLHLLKMCVGCDSVDDLGEWQSGRLDRGERLAHRTRNRPKRNVDVLDGGSLYWIIRGQIRVRQRILALDADVNGDGLRSCLIGLDQALIRTEPAPCRPMQGWRYLEAADAPPDLGAALLDGAALPASLVRELKLLGLA